MMAREFYLKNPTPPGADLFKRAEHLCLRPPTHGIGRDPRERESDRTGLYSRGKPSNSTLCLRQPSKHHLDFCNFGSWSKPPPDVALSRSRKFLRRSTGLSACSASGTRADYAMSFVKIVAWPLRLSFPCHLSCHLPCLRTQPFHNAPPPFDEENRCCESVPPKVRIIAAQEILI